MESILGAALAITLAAPAAASDFSTREGCLGILSQAIRGTETVANAAQMAEDMAYGTPAADAEQFPAFLAALRMVADGRRAQRDALLSICEAYPPEHQAPARASLTQEDMDALRLMIESCWNVGILTNEALSVVLTVQFDMTRDARPVPESIQLVSANGGSAAAQTAAFDAARQAIVECGVSGYGLPPQLHSQWETVEITFNPSRNARR